MYDLLLSGEGNSVIGSKNSMASNSYRKIFNSATNEVAENKGVDQWSVRSLSASDSSWGISRAVKTADGKFRSETHPKKFSSREAAAAAAKKLNSQKNESDMSGIMHAAKHLNKSFIITADVAEGGRKKYRVKAQSERVAQEKFAKHHSMAKIVDIKEE
jgi:hypothetical protein